MQIHGGIAIVARRGGGFPPAMMALLGSDTLEKDVVNVYIYHAP